VDTASAPAPSVPEVDTRGIVRLRDVLAGGHLGLQADRDLAAQILERWPGGDALVKEGNEFHRRAAARAVTGGEGGFPAPPAEGVIFAASGFPLGTRVDPESFRALPGGGFHPRAAGQAPPTLFVYADADALAVELSKGLLGAGACRAGGTPNPHTEADVAGWITAAGMDLVPSGITEVRGRELGWAAAKFGRLRAVARTVGAVAVVP
jgi:hypothetical protein